jgi:integrase
VGHFSRVPKELLRLSLTGNARSPFYAEPEQIFDMAVAEDLIGKNPAVLFFTPRETKRGQRLVMTIEEVKQCFAVLDVRERLIVQLALVAGMRPGEIFGLTWERIGPDYADILQRVYRGQVDRPKTVQSTRQAALSQGLLCALDLWRGLCIDTRPEAWVFPSEQGTPLSRDNILRRRIRPKLGTVGLAWVNFLVMRRTHSTLMNNLGVEGKLVADQLGHSLDVNQNVYTKSPNLSDFPPVVRSFARRPAAILTKCARPSTPSDCY